jgi:hypothetical protein
MRIQNRRIVRRDTPVVRSEAASFVEISIGCLGFQKYEVHFNRESSFEEDAL